MINTFSEHRTGRSWWELDALSNTRDLIIVGAGITGLSTALFYKRRFPKHDVLLLERGFWPAGATTRNAGFACFGSAGELLDDLQQGQDEVEAGIKLAGQAADAFEEIVDSTGGITDRVDSIATATEEQAATGDQISESVQSISEVSDESARGVEQVLGAAEELEELTGSLRGLIEEFHVGSEGGNRRPAGDQTGTPGAGTPGAAADGTARETLESTSGDGAAAGRDAPELSR